MYTCFQAKLKLSLSYEPPPSAAKGEAQGGGAEEDEGLEEEEFVVGEPGKPGAKP